MTTNISIKDKFTLSEKERITNEIRSKFTSKILCLQFQEVDWELIRTYSAAQKDEDRKIFKKDKEIFSFNWGGPHSLKLSKSWKICFVWSERKLYNELWEIISPVWYNTENFWFLNDDRILFHWESPIKDTDQVCWILWEKLEQYSNVWEIHINKEGNYYFMTYDSELDKTFFIKNWEKIDIFNELWVDNSDKFIRRPTIIPIWKTGKDIIFFLEYEYTINSKLDIITKLFKNYNQIDECNGISLIQQEETGELTYLKTIEGTKGVAGKKVMIFKWKEISSHSLEEDILDVTISKNRKYIAYSSFTDRVWKIFVDWKIQEIDKNLSVTPIDPQIIITDDWVAYFCVLWHGNITFLLSSWDPGVVKLQAKRWTIKTWIFNDNWDIRIWYQKIGEDTESEMIITSKWNCIIKNKDNTFGIVWKTLNKIITWETDSYIAIDGKKFKKNIVFKNWIWRTPWL